jgi:hypothetical protein
MEIKIRKNTAKWLDWNQYINWCSHYTGKLVEFSVNEPDKPSYLQNHYYYDSTISYPKSATNNDKIICAYYAEKEMWLVYDVEYI